MVKSNQDKRLSSVSFETRKDQFGQVTHEIK